MARVLEAALQAVEPGKAVSRHVWCEGERLVVGDRTYDLSNFDHIYLVGAGKAGAPMALATAQILGERMSQGVVIVKEGYSISNQAEVLPNLLILAAGHPLPDQRGVEGARKIVELVQKAGPDDMVICLISGGGSALLTSPAPGLTLADLRELTAVLLACGADIREINTLRKHLEQLKGGGLARMVTPAVLVTLILSDVIGDPLEVIASGPTVPDSTTFRDAYQILERYEILEKVPPAIVAHIRRGLQGELPETPKPGDPIFNRAQEVIIGNNLQAAQAALEEANWQGYHNLLLTTSLQGEARQAGRFLAAIARQINNTGQPIPRPACLIAGGETTVTLLGDGLGGRNQELALGAVYDLAGLADTFIITLATDGGDGPTDAAGAVVSGETLERARQIGICPAEYLQRNNAYHFFKTLGDLLITGPTQTNVNDLAFIFAH